MDSYAALTVAVYQGPLYELTRYTTPDHGSNSDSVHIEQYQYTTSPWRPRHRHPQFHAHLILSPMLIKPPLFLERDRQSMAVRANLYGPGMPCRRHAPVAMLSQLVTLGEPIESLGRTRPCSLLAIFRYWADRQFWQVPQFLVVAYGYYGMSVSLKLLRH